MTWATVYESMFKSNDKHSYLRRDLRNKAYKPTSFYWKIVVKLGAPAWNVSTRRNGRDPPRHLHETRDVFGRDRDETWDAEVRDRDETETLGILVETRPRRDVDTSRDRLETETSRPRPHPWLRPRPRSIKQQQEYIRKKLVCCNTHFCYQKITLCRKRQKV